MKLIFLIKVTNRATGRCFICLHQSNDLMFANPPITLDQMSGYEANITTSFTPELKQDIKLYGKHNFLLESLQASADRKALIKQRDANIKHLKESNVSVYNRERKPIPQWHTRPGYVPNSTKNPSKWPRNRKKASERMKAKIIERDAKGRILGTYTPEQWALKQQNGQIDVSNTFPGII